MTTLRDTARFEFDDPDECVMGSLACMVCLRRPVQVLLVEGAESVVALCTCPGCPWPTEVALSPLQLTRLATRPPRHLSLAWIN